MKTTTTVDPSLVEAKKAFVESCGGDVLVTEEQSRWFATISAILECGVLAAFAGRNIEGDERLAKVMSQWLGVEVDFMLFDVLTDRCVETVSLVGFDEALARVASHLNEPWSRREGLDFTCDFVRRRTGMSERQLVVLVRIGAELGFTEAEVRGRIQISMLPKQQRMRRRLGQTRGGAERSQAPKREELEFAN